MIPLRDAPIKHKLMVVILLTTSLALVFMAGTIITYELLTFRTAISTNTGVLAKVIGSISTSSLAFEDSDDAAEVLSVLSAEPQVTAAAIYDKKDQIFARFSKSKDGPPIPLTPGPMGTSYTSSHLTVYQPITEGDIRWGTIYVQADLSEMYSRMIAYGGLVLFAGITAIGGALAVSTTLQRRISLPIVQLAETARAVSERQDYTVRATRHGRDEIGDLTDAFNQMLTRIGETQEGLQNAKEAAEAANRAKDEFLAILSHELRTPLSPVLATLAMLEEDPGTPPGLQRELEMIRRNVEVEARLIDDLLDVTRITRGKLELHTHTVDVRTLLDHAVENYLKDPAERKQLSVNVEIAQDTATHIHADASRITQVLWNLLQNACKFTPQQGAITIHVSNAPPPAMNGGDPELVIQVRDTGIGIDSEVLPRIFDAFEQGERSRTRLFGGLGLGLAISRAIIELHGGTLTATSAGKDKGATFTIRLPTTPRPPLETHPTHSSNAVPSLDAAVQSSRILLVEDHADTAQQLKRLLNRAGHEVTCAVSLEEARKRAAEAPFDLVLSDLGLPDGSGHDLMRELGPLYGFPGIALSGYGMEEDVKESLTAGFARHLTKPVNWTELKVAIQGLVGTK